MTGLLPLVLIALLFLVGGIVLWRTRGTYAEHTRKSFERYFGAPGRAAADASTPRTMGLVAIAFMGIGVFALAIVALFLLWPLFE